MNCRSYMELTPPQKAEYIGKVVHAIQNSEICFSAGYEIITVAEMNGVFNGTTIMPDNKEQ